MCLIAAIYLADAFIRNHSIVPYLTVSIGLLCLSIARPARRSRAESTEWTNDKYNNGNQQQQRQQQQPKIISTSTIVHISNLASDVTEEDIEEILAETGKTKSIVLNYNRNGESQGTAVVTYVRANDATKAVDEFDKAEVDGRPMYMKLVGGVVTQQPRTVVKQAPAPVQYQQQYQQQQRSAPAPRQQRQRRDQQQQTRRQRSGSNGVRQQQKPQQKKQQKPKQKRERREKPKQMSLEDLDAEMDAYQNSRNAGNGAAVESAPAETPAAAVETAPATEAAAPASEE